MVFSTSKLVALTSDLEVTLVKPILPYSVANNIINNKHAYYSVHAESSSF